ncbi:helix-turn-helix transcriptional regulator [Cytobacillus sp. IB215316]|uniref:helix-turn-helix transcriptional regulator n=1 Tax=Cytobacillus sp. IB215316 TaxID=3097354 RepID=UPI002A0D49F5|nr:helix-turn-helix transcriptional regulator [Cytobacillus sp. IB215316]MDX8361766.1 helix-turn-helix transcriptional regulator [Cytobacillus sp. IB215316]
MVLKETGYLENRLSILRAEKKWSQKEVANKLGVSRQTIISIENNRYNPSLKLAYEISLLFNKDINEVFQYNRKGEESC